jgi:hypothetical protein
MLAVRVRRSSSLALAQLVLPVYLRRRITVALVLSMALLAGCGSSGSGETSAPAPKLLSIKDLEKQPAGSPEAALYRLHFFIQWGSARNLIAMIDPDVTNAVGIPDLIDAYAFLRPGLAASRLRIAGKMSTREGQLITYEVIGPSGPSQTDSALFGKIGNQYVVLYDSLLDRGIPGSILAANTDKPETVAGKREVADRVQEVMTRYHTAAGVPVLEAAAKRKLGSDASSEAGKASR